MYNPHYEDSRSTLYCQRVSYFDSRVCAVARYAQKGVVASSLLFPARGCWNQEGTHTTLTFLFLFLFCRGEGGFWASGRYERYLIWKWETVNSSFFFSFSFWNRGTCGGSPTCCVLCEAFFLIFVDANKQKTKWFKESVGVYYWMLVADNSGKFWLAECYCFCRSF